MYHLIVYEKDVKIHDIERVVSYSVKGNRLYYHLRNKKNLSCSGLIRLNEDFLLRIEMEE